MGFFKELDEIIKRNNEMTNSSRALRLLRCVFFTIVAGTLCVFLALFPVGSIIFSGVPDEKKAELAGGALLIAWATGWGFVLLIYFLYRPIMFPTSSKKS